MSLSDLIYKNQVPNEGWKKLGVKAVYTDELHVGTKQITYDSLDQTIPVNTYDAANVLIQSDVFSFNIHAIRIGHVVNLTIPALFHTASAQFNYFGFQLPTDFHPLTLNAASYITVINTNHDITKIEIATNGFVKIYKDLIKSDYLIGDSVDNSQQTILYDNTN